MYLIKNQSKTKINKTIRYFIIIRKFNIKFSSIKYYISHKGSEGGCDRGGDGRGGVNCNGSSGG